jgi:hypothetical protein
MRLYPVADGVIKHQLYYTQPGGARMVNPAVMTVWSWKATGSPVSGARMTAEQNALDAWVRSAAFRAAMQSNTTITDIRSWDYGLDPAPRTARFMFPYTFGSVGGNINRMTLAEGWIVALRSQPVGSPIRDRLNGRITHPYGGIDVGTGNVWPSATVVLNAYTPLRATVLDGTGDKGRLCVVSYRSGGAIRVVPQVVLVDHVIVQRAGVQRRRNARPGPYDFGS